MKVILNIETVRWPLTGIGRYAYELGRALERSGRLEALLLWSGSGPRPAWPDFGTPNRPSRAAIRPYLEEALKKSPLAASLAFAFKETAMAGRLRKYGDYIYHGPNFYLPPKSAGGRVVTVHDLSALVQPESMPEYRRRLTAAALKNLPRRADYVLTVSEFVRREIIDLLSWPAERISVAPPAAVADFRPRSAADLAPGLARLSLKPGGYALFVGTVEPRKNIGLLLDAYEGLPNRLRRAFPLVVAGARGWQSQALHRRLAASTTRGWLRYLGFHPDGELPALMAGAALFLFPSLYEGFGLPPLEAMSCGVPALVSDRAALPEVAGTTASCLPAMDAEAWREAIHKGLEDVGWRKEQAGSCLARAAEFSWERCAAGALAAYEAVG